MRRFHATLLYLGVLFVSTPAVAEDKRPIGKTLPASAPGAVDFQRDIQPIFKRACLSCHGSTKQRNGLRLDNRTDALKGGDSGVAIKPGDAEHSRLLLAVAGLDPDIRMPPEGNEPLTTVEIGRLRAWIEQGANWPRDASSPITPETKSFHWATLPPTPQGPHVSPERWLPKPIG